MEQTAQALARLRARFPEADADLEGLAQGLMRLGARAALAGLSAEEGPLAWVGCDAGSRILAANAAARELGLGPGEVIEAQPLSHPQFVAAPWRMVRGQMAMILPHGTGFDLMILPQGLLPLGDLLDAIEDELSLTDGESRLVYANRAWSEAHGGVRPARGPAPFLPDVLPLHEALREAAADAMVLGGALVPAREIRRESRSSSAPARRLRQDKRALRDYAGHPWAVLTRTSDRTEALQLEEDMRFADLVVEQSLDCILVTDPAFRLRSANPAFLRMTGFHAASLRGKALEALIPGHEAEGAAWRDMIRTLPEEGHWRGELTLRGTGGERIVVWCAASQLQDETGRLLGHVLVQSDLTQLFRMQDENDRLARFDTLTRLPNRTAISDRMDEALTRARRNRSSAAVIFFDLDAFKSVNDSLGHAAGDQLLVTIAGRLVAAAGPGSMVARIGGDEFLILLPDADALQACQLAERLLAEIARPVDLEGLPAYRPSASLGVAVFPDHGMTRDELMRSADTAMYAAKAQHCHIEIFRSDMRQAATQMLEMRNALTGAVARGEFRLVYQPIRRLSDGALVGAEALLRWMSPGRGLLAPGEFLPVAEMAGLMRDIDRWVLNRAAADIAAWRASGIFREGWWLSVNQTSGDLLQPDWLEGVADAVAIAGRDALQIELTEGHMTGSLEALQRSLRALEGLGVRLAVDDFGTGSSNLSYLRTLPISTLKIDRSFVRGIESDEGAQVLVRAMLGLGHQFGYVTLAEGIETEAQAEFLRAAGCALGQGFLMAMPMETAAFTRLLLAGGMMMPTDFAVAGA